MSDWYRIARLCDMHVPFEDTTAVNAAFEFVTRIQPDEIILDELHDFYACSRFVKDPDRATSLQDELDAVGKHMKELRKRCPNAKITILESNHTDRLQRYLWSEAPALSKLKCLLLPKLMSLSDYEIGYKPNINHRGVFLSKHGTLIRKHSAYTAHWEFESEGMSGMSGHSHRAGEYNVTKRSGEYTWIEAGCLCSMTPEYMKSIPNWQHAVGFILFEGNTKQFSAMSLKIINGKILWS